MCGVAAIHAYHRNATAVSRAELAALSARLAPRGPDGSGEWCSEDGRVALAHRRLAIIDPDARAAQPMHSPGRSAVLSFNGEIYNFRALREELERGGLHFRTSSDTEVLLALYERDGTDMFSRLRGMYAFVLWDAVRRRLLLARDPFGIKPLYYADDGRCVRVASQVKALLAGGAVSREPDPAGLVGFLMFGSVPEPFTCSRAIRAVPAGCWLGVDEHGPSRPVPHYELARVHSESGAAPPRPEPAIELAHAAFRDSVKHHLVADVRVGTFLSGGVDSGAIAGLMRDLCPGPPLTVTVRFAEFLGTRDDEGPLAQATAERYGCDHQSRMVGEEEFRSELPSIIDAMDLPSIDGMNTWFAAKACRERGLKAALSGLGGDELLGGYPSFGSLPQWVALMAAPSRVPLLGKGMRKILGALLAQQSFVSPKLAGLVELAGSWEGAYLARRGLFMPWELGDLLPPDVVTEGLQRLQWRELVGEVIQPDPGSDHARVATLESGLYLRNQLLRDSDWAGMAHSLEVRTPLVDCALANALAALPTSAGRDERKGWLASAPRTPLPPEVLARRKTGFLTPIGIWSQRAPALDAWRNHPTLARRSQHWSRRLSVAMLHAFGLMPSRSPQPRRGRAGTPKRGPPDAACAGSPDVVHFQRRAFEKSHSVERVFHDLRGCLERNGMPIRLRVNRHRSQGLFPRAVDVLASANAQGEVNHVTGDVHYLTYLLDPARTILTVLDCVGLHRMRGIRRAAFLLLWYWLPSRRCRYITTISEFTKNDLLSHLQLDPRRIVVIYPSLSGEFTHVPAPFNARCPRILQMGTGSNKNLDRVAAALEGIACRLVIIGRLDREQRARLDATGIAYVNRRNLSRDELRREYEDADMLVFASTYEGFGLPIIEANAVGRPVVTSDRCSMPEVAGGAACLVDPHSVESIRQGLLRVICDEEYRSRLVSTGLANAERFRVATIAGQYAELYRRVQRENRELGASDGRRRKAQ